ncbi:MAG: BA14K family protein [Rhizobiaceae bacterium]|nr:BA14K family protein [Rhizobiaceae bacterium]MCV0405175.1 BA14K family protein [Rhizobiaceae bacterium]
MKTLKSSLCTAIAMTFALGSATPVAAAPVVGVPQAPSVSADIVQVQSRRDRGERRREWRRDRADRRRDRREARFERRGGVPYYRGHRGYRDRRPGYRQYNGFWFPPAAFIAGAIIGGATAGRPVARRYGDAHVRWCYDRWRSYRASDNTYQPYNGPRRQCVSPYS